MNFLEVMRVDVVDQQPDHRMAECNYILVRTNQTLREVHISLSRLYQTVSAASVSVFKAMADETFGLNYFDGDA